MKQTRAIAYLRVSTAKQVEQGLSLEAQESKVRAYAELYDLIISAVLVDAGESAASLDRPQLQLALSRIKRGEADALVVVKLDRLTRSVADLGRLVDEYFGPNGADLLSVSENIDTRTAGGRLVLNVLASVSQWEREAIAERTAAVMQHKAANGEYTGGIVPYGFRLAPVTVAGVPVRLEQEPREMECVALARSLRAGGLSLRAVAKRLEQAGHLARSGGRFTAQQVSRIVGGPDDAT